MSLSMIPLNLTSKLPIKRASANRLTEPGDVLVIIPDVRHRFARHQQVDQTLTETQNADS